MEIKDWTYEDFPEFKEPVEGAEILSTSGDEVGLVYLRDVEYASVIYQKPTEENLSLYCVCTGLCLDETGCICQDPYACPAGGKRICDRCGGVPAFGTGAIPGPGSGRQKRCAVYAEKQQEL